MNRAALLLVLAAALVACAPAARPAAPAAPTASAAARAAVLAERHEIPGFPEPHAPPNLNRAAFVRYHAGAAAPRAVVVLVPGFLGGAANFDALARDVVARDPSLEVWAVDRRSNLLEDQSRLQDASRRRDPMIAWRYYVRDAKRPGGFQPLAASDAAFMGYWGLPVHLGDLRAVVLDAHRAAPRVFLGGHSLGSVIATLYAGWDFAGRAGFEDIDGLILLDGALGSTVAFDVTPSRYEDGFDTPFGRTPGTRALEGGSAAPFTTVLGLDPAGLAALSARALLAALDPNGDSPGGFVPYPASNLAAAMIEGDDDYAPVPIFSVSAGRADAAVAGNLAAVLVNGVSGLGVASVTGPAPGRSRVEWVPPGPGDADEHTDPLEFVRSFWTENADFQEWYFPARLTLDVAAVGAAAPAWARASLPFTRLAEYRGPVLAVRAGRGVTAAADAFRPLERALGRRVDPRELPGFTHLDVLVARDNPLGAWIAAFTRD